MDPKQNRSILWFDQVGNDDAYLVGSKNASLGEMYTQLTPEGVRVPNGFIITAHAYKEFIQETGLVKIIQKELKSLNTSNTQKLQQRGKTIRKAFLRATFPEELVREIHSAYMDLSNAYSKKNTDVAVRSSVTPEDLTEESLTGEYKTFLNITGEGNVLYAIKRAMASLFTDRAISYRIDKGFNHFDIALSVSIQKMVRSDKGASGAMFTLDKETGFRDVVQIKSSWGLGGMAVQGKVAPDEFMVFKPTLKEGYEPIIKKIIGSKKRKIVYQNSRTKPTREVAVPEKDCNSTTLSDKEVLTLAKWAVRIEDHYSHIIESDISVDIEWAKDGATGSLYIVQACPSTVLLNNKGYDIKKYKLKEEGRVIVEGIPIGTKITAGRARIILSIEKLHEFEEGDVLITKTTDLHWESIMKMASAIITEKGGRTSHAAMVSQELGIPAVVGVGDILSNIKNGDKITIDSSSGGIGRVYKGFLKWEEKIHNLEEVPKVKTKISMNIGSPEGVFAHARLPHRGVGLAREEFIIASHIGIHPLALVNFNKLKDKTLKRKIENRTLGYKDKKEYYIEKLSQGIAQIGAAFFPEKVIVRFSDFKTNEYRELIGGELYEPEEENPTIGLRGASRYTNPEFMHEFGMECEAIKRVREVFGLKNVVSMVPFCRTPEEGQKVIDLMRKYGLEKGVDGLSVYVTCELPANVLRADEFLDVFDGFSVDATDLAQATLGVDVDSCVFTGTSNENDPAVRMLVESAIKACQARDKYIGLCGQSYKHPEFLRFLIQKNVDSISISPNFVIPTLFEIAEEEAKQ